MIWADFWSTVEPNLGIFCVSLPMLGRLRSRLTSRRGASKLEGPSSEDATGSRRYAGGTGRKPATGAGTDDEGFGLETIYASNKHVYHESSVAGGAKPPAAAGGAPSRDGSEEALTLHPTNTDMDKSGIMVQTKWTITSG